VTFLLSLGAAILFGSGDFVGGLVSRRAGPLQVAVASQWIGLALLVPAFLIFGGRPNTTSLTWGAASGLATGLGLVFLFRALAAEAMAIGAALAGIVTAVLPLAFGLLAGERPATIAMIGLVFAIGSIALIVYQSPSGGGDQSGPGSGRRLSPASLRRPGAVEGIIAGVGWGGASIFLAQTPIDGGLWPLASAQTTTVLILTAIALGSGTRVIPPRDAVPPSAAVGVLHLSGAVLFLVALQRGLLTLVAVVQSLYPAVTILLARLVLKERLAPRQVAGLIVAGVGVALIGLG
jgi:drug/metabolite transporter (DMT)-like permease